MDIVKLLEYVPCHHTITSRELLDKPGLEFRHPGAAPLVIDALDILSGKVNVEAELTKWVTIIHELQAYAERSKQTMKSSIVETLAKQSPMLKYMNANEMTWKGMKVISVPPYAPSQFMGMPFDTIIIDDITDNDKLYEIDQKIEDAVQEQTDNKPPIDPHLLMSHWAVKKLQSLIEPLTPKNKPPEDSEGLKGK